MPSGIITSGGLEKIFLQNGPYDAMGAFFSLLSGKLDKPLVLMIDEIDALVDDTLISVLRQIRAGYDSRPVQFPSSIILCGVRDYRILSDRDKAIITVEVPLTYKQNPYDLEITLKKKSELCFLNIQGDWKGN